MADLRLIALDTEDLSVVSAHLQDAVVRVSDMAYLHHEKRFAAVVNRFDWEHAAAAQKSAGKITHSERRRAGLRFERVLGAKVHGLDLKDRKAVLALLSISFSPAAEGQPDGDVTLTFSGGAAIRLQVECLEAELKDLGAAWATKHIPVHPEPSSGSKD
jgi:hypothetical protein